MEKYPEGLSKEEEEKSKSDEEFDAVFGDGPRKRKVVFAINSSEDVSPQYLQKKLYFLIENLKSYHEKLPMKVQMKIPYELIMDLANSLLQKNTFEIVIQLIDLQNCTEKYLFQEREKAENEYELEIREWELKIDDKEELEHIIELMKIKHNKRLRELDKQSILQLDKKVTDQQIILQQAGIPGFYATSNPKEIIIQMHLLDFILRLSKLSFMGQPFK